MFLSAARYKQQGMSIINDTFGCIWKKEVAMTQKQFKKHSSGQPVIQVQYILIVWHRVLVIILQYLVVIHKDFCVLNLHSNYHLICHPICSIITVLKNHPSHKIHIITNLTFYNKKSVISIILGEFSTSNPYLSGTTLIEQIIL